jgi:gliding motility-associated-like protein
MTVNPNLPVGNTITGSANTVCLGTPVTFTATPTNGGSSPSYQWYVNGLISGPDSSIFTYSSYTNIAVYCVLTSNLNCTTGNPATSNTINILINPVTPVNLGPDTSICPGSTVILNAGACAGCSYLWSNLTTGQQNIGTGQTYSTGNAGEYCITVTDTNECVSRDTLQLFYHTISPTISGNNTPCMDTVSYAYQTETGMSNYQWSTSPGGTIVSGLGTNQITVKWSYPGTQTVMVNYTTTDGCTAINPYTYQILVSPVPGPAGTINGPSQLCIGYPDQNYSVDSIIYAQSYIWEVTSGIQIMAGQGTKTITILLIDTTVNSGDLYVYGMNLCGNGLLSPPFHFNVMRSPSVDAGPDQSILFNSTALLHGMITRGSGLYSYSWEPSALLIDDTTLNPKTIKITQNTLFILTVTDLVTGCQGNDTVWIMVTHNEPPEDCLVIHNVITPNGDGVNDKWIIDCIENFPENDIIIFNIWGDIIIRFQNYDNIEQVWAGTNNNGRPLPDGTYYYILSIKNGGKHYGWIFVRGN